MEVKLKKPSLSIIVPVYNVEFFLRECIESILNQEYKDFELILVDDGSKDHSPAICDEYKDRDNKVKVIHQTNQGQMRATKNGIDIATGEYIGFVDSDDWISTTMYKNMMSAAYEKHSDIVIVSGQRLLKKNRLAPFENKFDAGFYDRQRIEAEILPHMLNNRDLYGNRGIQPSKCLKIFKSKIVRDVYSLVPLEVKLGEDMACSYACISKAQSITILDKDIRGYFYRLNNNSISWTYKPNVFQQSMTLCNFLRHLPGTENMEDYQKDVYYEECFFTINAFYNEYLIDNQLHGQIKKDRLTVIVNNPQFIKASSMVDMKTIKAPNRFILRLLKSKNIQAIRFFGGILAIFRHIIIGISQRVM